MNRYAWETKDLARKMVGEGKMIRAVANANRSVRLNALSILQK